MGVGERVEHHEVVDDALVAGRGDRGPGLAQPGQRLQLESSTLSPLLKRLDANGLLRRERRAEDERSVAPRLTDAGSELRERAGTVPVVIGDAMDLTPEQDAMAKQLLRLLTTNVTR